MTTLYQHQIDFLKENPNKTTLVWSCGTGKTRAAIEWSKQSKLPFTLIICPKSLKINWIREVKKWEGNTVTVMTKEEFRKDHTKLPTYNQVIVDEVHNGFLTPMFKSQMSKALRDYIKKHDVQRVLLLSATVYTSSPWNIYSLAKLTGHDWNYRDFKDAFFFDVRMGPRIVPMVKKGIEERLARATKKISNVVDIKDVLDVPLQNHCEPEYFKLNKEQIRAIKDSYDPVPIVRYTKQHEVEQGILIGNEFADDQSFPCDKNDRILQLVEENPKIAIVARYNNQIDYYIELLKDYNPLVIRGNVKDRDSVCLLAESSNKSVVLIQADCAEGYQLPSFPICVFASQSYAYTKWEQICGRFLRMDKPSRTTFIYLLTEGDSIDQGVFNSVAKKKDFSISLYAKERSEM